MRRVNRSRRCTARDIWYRAISLMWDCSASQCTEHSVDNGIWVDAQQPILTVYAACSRSCSPTQMRAVSVGHKWGESVTNSLDPDVGDMHALSGACAEHPRMNEIRQRTTISLMARNASCGVGIGAWANASWSRGVNPGNRRQFPSITLCQQHDLLSAYSKVTPIRGDVYEY
jgi:hypothetical protein